MNFGAAIEALQSGCRVQRSGWNGKNMYLVLIPGGTTEYPTLENGKKTETLPWIGMLTAQGNFVPWLASQTDILANDWQGAL